MSQKIIPNPEQKAAIDHDQGPLLIVAGAGTGKTRVLTDRIASLIIDEKAKVHEILAMTFTEKAALEMEERIDKSLPYGYVDLWVMTFHSFCDKLLRTHAFDIGLSNDYKLLDQTQAWLLIRKNLDKFNLDYYRPLGNPTKFIHALINHFSRCKDEGISPENYLEHAQNLKLDTDSREFITQLNIENLSTTEQGELKKTEILRLTEVADSFHVYQNILLENNCLDFADLLTYTVQLFTQRPMILQKYRQQFKYLLVDEFQDTNTIQYNLIKMLAEPKNNLTVVGDDDQSIYRFRGASISNIMQFKEDFPDAKEIVLTKNYRSTQEILDLSYKFIRQNNPYRLEEKLKINKKLDSQIKAKSVIEHLHFDNYENEAIGVVNKILELQEKDQDATWKDFAILVRANDTAKIYTELLEQAKIPYKYMAMSGLYVKKIILDLINYFKLLDNYHESSAMFRVLNFDCWAIDNTQIVKINHFAQKNQLSLYEACKQVVAINGLEKSVFEKINKIVTLIDKHSDLAAKNNLGAVYNQIIREVGLLDYLLKQNNKKSAESLEYLSQFFEKIKSFETANEDKSLKLFMELYQMELQAGETGKLKPSEQEHPEEVRLMTIHMAKGLEFKYVFIVSLVDRKFPSDQRKEPIEIPGALLKTKTPDSSDDSHLHEERRLFYVAMTRAKQGLFTTSANDYGGVREKKLSRFLIELDYSKNKIISGHQPTEKSQKTIAKSEIILPKYFSVSSLALYEKCPYQFYLAKIIKIPTVAKSALTFGDVIHQTLKEYVEQCCQLNTVLQTDLFGQSKPKSECARLTLTDLKNLYEKNWKNEGYENKQEKQKYYEKGQNILKFFYNDFIKENPQIKFIEQPFKYKINNEFMLKGRIDRVDEEDGRAVIVDYKTGQAKSQKMSSADKQQLIFYDIVLREIFKLETQKALYYYLENDFKCEIEISEKDREKIKQKFIDLISAILEHKFDPTPNQFVCQFCPFNDICDFRKM